MAQHLFNGETPSDKANLDANFSEVYGRTQALTGATGRLGINKTPGTGIALDVVGNVVFGQSGSGFDVADVSSTNSVNMRMLASGNSSNAGIGTTSNHPVYLQTNSTSRLQFDAGYFRPASDNGLTAGAASFRWSTVYAATGSINTSDAREKTSVTPLTTAEIAAAQDLVANIGIYQWLAAIQAKGEGDARKHVGMTVQQAIAVMTSHGLDPMSYGFICYDSWPAIAEIKDDDGNVVQAPVAAGDRYSFRPDELGMFIARGVAASLAAIDARLTALEAH